MAFWKITPPNTASRTSTRIIINWALGTAASRRAAPSASIFLASSFLCSQEESTPAHTPLTQTVETVEKVTFQKLFLKSGTETMKSVWFLVFRTTFWQFFSLLWEIFLNIFRTKGFSTVSLGALIASAFGVGEFCPCRFFRIEG